MKRFLPFALAVIVFAAYSKDAINEQQNMLTIFDEAPETITVGFEGDVTRINDGEQVAGELYINSTDATAALASDMGNADDNNAGGNLVFEDTILTEVTLDSGEGVALGKEATAFYIALPPQTFEQGLMIEIEDTEDYVMEQSTDKALIIERNTIKPMAALKFINPNRPTQPTPASNEIWYSATAKSDPYFDDSLTFGANVVSNVWDSETKRGVITFDGDVTMIGDDAFNNCDKFTGVTLPESVTSIGKKAFSDCDGLTEFTIPDSVTEIGGGAFRNCDSLTSVNIPDSVTTIGEGAFYYCTSLKSVNIPNSITTIEAWAFYYCTSLTSVNIPDSVTTIGEGAFAYCYSLTSVNIPDSVTTIGNYAFYDCDSLTEFTGKFAEDNGRILVVDGVLTAFAPAGITEYNTPDSVTSIGEAAFNSCTSLTSVTIGDSVTSIGEAAFYGCTSLTSVNIPDSVTTIGSYAFEYCTRLTSVNIPDSVTSIGIYAFAYCYSLTSVNIPDSVTTIGNYAFSYCTSLTEFTGKFAEDNGRILVVDGVLTAFAPAGITEYNIPDGVTSIGNNAFYSCDSLTSVNIGDSVTSIGYEAFYKCTSLKKVYCYATIPPSLGYDAFSSNASGRRIYVYEECVELYKSAWSSYNDSIFTNGENCPDTTTIEYTTNDGNIVTTRNMPVVSNIYENGVGTLVFSSKEIPSSAFCECTSLTSVTIGDSVTSIGETAFAYCDSLTSVNIPDSVTKIGNYAFSGCTSLTSVNIHDSVTTIGEWAFAYCDSLTSVNIPDSVTKIGNYAFSGCTSLTSVNIPDSVTTIGEWAFAYCDSLTSVNIPDSVTTIGERAFGWCTSLTSVYCKATTPPALGGTDVFDYNDSGRKIYVPAGSVNAYKSTAYWDEYKYAIVGYNF